MKKVSKIISRVVMASAVVLVVAFVVLYIATWGGAPVAETAAQDATIPQVTIDGVTFHAETFGDRASPVAVVVHGGPGADYRSLLSLQELADQFYVVFYDQRGTGLSPRVPTEELTLESAIADLDRIVEHYGGGKPVGIVGHSWGAMLAAAYIGRHPEKVDKVVLAEPGALTSEAFKAIAPYLGRMDIPLLWSGTLAWFESLHIHGPDEQAPMDHIWTSVGKAWSYAAWNGYNCPGTQAPPDFAWRYSAASQHIIASASDENGNVDLAPLSAGLDRYPNSVLFLVSACNRWIGLEHQQRYHIPLFKDTQVAIVPNAGHEMFGENPADSIAAVRAYLSE